MRRCEKSVVSDLRAGFALPSLAQCVEELVLNSIDANAKTVTVRVGVEKGFIQIADDGDGIPLASFGRLGEAYSSSKCQSLEELRNVKTFGFRGETLAALRMLAESLEVQSKHICSGYTVTKVFKRGEPLPVRSVDRLSDRGTIVIVKNLYHSLPVRQASLLSPSNLNHVCHSVKTVALIHPDVSITLRDDYGSQLVSSARGFSVTGLFASLFDCEKARKLRPVSVVRGIISISGYICRDGHINRSLQFLFINSRQVEETRIHQLLEELFQHSMITQKSVKESDINVRSLHAVYVLNLTCPSELYDITLEPGKRLVEFRDWQSVLASFEEIIQLFLRNQGLCKGYRVPFTIMPRITRQPVATLNDKELSQKLQSQATGLATSSVISCKVMRKRPEAAVSKETAVCVSCQHSGTTQSLYQVIASTPGKINSKVSEKSGSCHCPASYTSHSSSNTAKKRRFCVSNSMGDIAFNKMVSNCTDYGDNGSIHIMGECRSSHSVSSGLNAIGEALRHTALMSHPSGLFRFNKAMLSNAKVVGQVDNKFIACLINLECKGRKSETLSLVLVDQHAAHERVRLEEIQDDLVVDGALRSGRVDPPVHVRLPDGIHLQPHGLHEKLEPWGIRGSVSVQTGQIDVVIVGAPIILMKNDSCEVASFQTLKNLITELISSGQSSCPQNGWPLSLVDVLNSKACHGKMWHHLCTMCINQV
jgi:DNA mismatch repair protein MLH3